MFYMITKEEEVSPARAIIAKVRDEDYQAWRMYCRRRGTCLPRYFSVPVLRTWDGTYAPTYERCYISNARRWEQAWHQWYYHRRVPFATCSELDGWLLPLRHDG